MKESIGNVILDYEYYPGKDLYSDGAVEDELLEIAKQYDEDEWNHVIAEKKSWPILYHYSHVRQNIVSWLPISEDDQVLEIGSGCGAITGALARKAASVTCVELSKKRSSINAWRHRGMTNIEILVGNFQDIEKTLGQFDVITLIGVFEYSNGYIGGDHPFENMLKIISKHLKPDGRLVIAIENRLGLKYWAGCTEDHTGKYFEGIEDYPVTRSVHTFSNQELSEVISRAGGLKYRMYYPYPDYKFPLAIYSDERLPQQGELKILEYNYDRERMVLFDEIKAADSLIRSNLFPVFSNSFLVILTPDQAEESDERCIYAKYSNERSDMYSTRTEIWKMGSDREVRKISESDNSNAFVEDNYTNYLSLKEIYRDSPFHINRCRRTGSGTVAFEYRQGKTLEEYLDILLKEKKFEILENTLNSLFDVLRKPAEVPFKMTSEFREVFGEAAFERNLLCPQVCNIDVIPGNILNGDREWEMLDYEWSFRFPVPVEYQIYRIIHYYIYSSTARSELINHKLFEKAGITADEMNIFAEMERHFQLFIQKDKVPMREMYRNISPGIFFDVKDIDAIKRKLNTRKIQIYTDVGNDFSEENSFYLNADQGNFEGQIDFPENAVRLRIDPCEELCIIQLKEYMLETADGAEKLPVICTGRWMAEGLLYFSDADPYFLIDLPRKKGRIRMVMQIWYLGVDADLPVGQSLDEKQYIQNREQVLIGEKHSLQNKLEESEKAKTDAEERTRKLQREFSEYMERVQKENNMLREKIRQMENTKIWKTYQKIKGKK